MASSNLQPERPPWPDDMEQAFTAQEERLRGMALKAKARRPENAMRTQLISWTVRILIIAITFWLLCETVIV